MLRAIKLKYYLAQMERRGISVGSILNGTKISASKLDDVDYLIDPWQSSKFIDNMIEQTGDEGLAFELAKDFDITDLGIIGYAMLSSKNARDAVQLWIDYSHYLVGMLVQMRLQEYETSWNLCFNGLVKNQKTFIFCTEELLLFALFLGERITGNRFVLEKVELAYPPPEHRALYNNVFPCEVLFNQPCTCITVKSPSLDTKLSTNDKELHAVCLSHCDQIIRHITSNSPLATRIRILLLENCGRIPELQEVADQLNCSTRSLKRHLRQQGLSYQQLVNEFRNDLAKEYFKQSNMTPKEIGYLLGYDEASSFRRAFKSWNGYTIQEFLNKLDSENLKRGVKG
jgi:AraC-like DNA-binding protein